MQRNDDGEAARWDRGRKEKGDADTPFIVIGSVCLYSSARRAKVAKREYDISIAPIGIARSCFPCDDYANNKQDSYSSRIWYLFFPQKAWKIMSVPPDDTPKFYYALDFLILKTVTCIIHNDIELYLLST